MPALPDPTTHAEAVARLKAIQARQAGVARRLVEALEVRRRETAESRRLARRAASPIGAIIAEVAEAHGLTYRDVLGASRKAAVVRARQQAIAAVAAERPDLSLPQLGQHFDGRDHTTILHALRAVHGRGYRHRPAPRVTPGEAERTARGGCVDALTPLLHSGETSDEENHQAYRRPRAHACRISTEYVATRSQL